MPIMLVNQHPEGKIPIEFSASGTFYKFPYRKPTEVSDETYKVLENLSAFQEALEKKIIVIGGTEAIAPTDINNVSPKAALAKIDSCNDISQLKEIAQSCKGNEELEQAIQVKAAEISAQMSDLGKLFQTSKEAKEEAPAPSKKGGSTK